MNNWLTYCHLSPVDPRFFPWEGVIVLKCILVTVHQLITQKNTPALIGNSHISQHNYWEFSYMSNGILIVGMCTIIDVIIWIMIAIRNPCWSDKDCRGKSRLVPLDADQQLSTSDSLHSLSTSTTRGDTEQWLVSLNLTKATWLTCGHKQIRPVGSCTN